MQKFPNNFFWGTAISAHQTEGNNTNSDWWHWEQSKDKEGRHWPLEPSGIACDSYYRYEEDFDLAVGMNNNSLRFSVEWARIEPQEGVFDEKEIEHYKKVIKAAKDRGLKIFVTLHHFTSPQWFYEKGGWPMLKAPFYFERYAKKCAEVFGDSVDFYLTINEPQVYAGMGYVLGQWFPSKKSIFLAALINFNFISAHRKAYSAIKKVNKDLQVGIVQQIVWHQAFKSKNKIIYVADFLLAKIKFFLMTDGFLGLLKNRLDFIGLNYYFTEITKNLSISDPNNNVENLVWWSNPIGLKKILLFLRKYKLPIYITENGMATSDDKERITFLKNMLNVCSDAISEKVDLRGYFYWALIDNYEWSQGFWPRFGLVEIDRSDNLKRKPRNSYSFYAKICQNNGESI
jgi:beta-glucosidase